MYYFYEKDYKPITVQYHITDCVRYLDQLCGTYKQIGLMNALSEWNSFTCKGLTVLEVKSSAMLGLVGSNQSMLCPWALSFFFFLRLCPARFPPVSERQ